MSAARPDTWMPGRWTRFDPRDFDVPAIAAVYAIFIGSEVVYVGQTSNLRNRFQRHNFRAGYARNIITPWGSIPDEPPIYAKARPARRYGDWAMIELRLLKRLRPRLNATFVNTRTSKRVA